VLCILVSWFGLVASTCQVIGWEDSSDDAYPIGDYLHKDQDEKHICLYFFPFSSQCYCVFVTGPREHISYAHGMI